jgi:DNA (cytosine-5)-methyltransferase 1
MRLLPKLVLNGEIDAPDILVGGTPCQGFSVAGRRGGLKDPRGQLTLSYVELADAIDQKREQRGDEPCVIVWENVPGVFSDKGNAFGHFLASLVGEIVALEPPGGRWSNVGYVSGPKRSAAWIVKDAQYFGVAQRRRRVFVVASAREGFNPEEVLFEFDGSRRDDAPERTPWREDASTIEGSVDGSGGTIVAARMVGFGGYVEDDIASTLKSRDYKDVTDLIAFNQSGFAHFVESDVCSPIRSGNANGDGDARSSTLLAIAIQERASSTNMSAGPQGKGWQEDVSYTLESRHSVQSVAYAFRDEMTPKFSYEVTPTLLTTSPTGGGHPMPVAFNSREDTVVYGDVSGTLASSSPQAQTIYFEGAGKWIVRRLMPIECERLQGFSDLHTLVSFKGKLALDSPRYKAIGNSKAVPVVRWIGRRIQRMMRQLETIKYGKPPFEILFEKLTDVESF